MNPRRGTLWAALPLFAASLVIASACSLDVLGPLGEHGRPGEIMGVVRSLDTYRGRIEVRESYGRRTWTVYYDRWTDVYYGRRRYPITGLRRGDEVRIRLDYDRHGRPWAEWVEVRRGGW